MGGWRAVVWTESWRRRGWKTSTAMSVHKWAVSKPALIMLSDLEMLSLPCARELAKRHYKLRWRSLAPTLAGASSHWGMDTAILKVIAEMFWGRAAQREARLCSGIEFIKVQESSLQRGCVRQWKMLCTVFLMDLCPLWIHQLKRLCGVQSSWNIQCDQKRAETLVLLEPPCCWWGDCAHNRLSCRQES